MSKSEPGKQNVQKGKPLFFGGILDYSDRQSGFELPMESYKRSLAKTLSWRLVSIVLTSVIAFLITGKIKAAVTIGATDMALKFGIYYLHERTWARVKYGRVKEPEYQI